MPTLYPLRFEPLFRRYLWGGRRLQTYLGKPLGEGHDYAESWEIVDHGQDQSVVAFGPLAGQRLNQLVHQFPRQLAADQDRFPLLMKFLDCHRVLSVQVHPDDRQAAALDPPDLGKTEAWVVMHAEPGSVIYAGLKRGFDRAALQREVNRGTTELCLHRIEPRAGDCILIPAGTVHALGAGLVVAEIQQASDTTYRLFDWNRVGADGQPRALHVEQALDTIRYDAPPIALQVPETTDDVRVQRLVACDKFVMDRWTWQGDRTLERDQRFHILAVMDGAVVVDGDPANRPLTKGQTMLVPADVGPLLVRAEQPSVILDIYR